MKNSYTQIPPPVKENSRFARFKSRYPLMWGWKNILILASPFFIAWLLFGLEKLAIMLAAWLAMLIYCLRENNYQNNRLLRLTKKTGE